MFSPPPYLTRAAGMCKGCQLKTAGLDQVERKQEETQIGMTRRRVHYHFGRPF